MIKLLASLFVPDSRLQTGGTFYCKGTIISLSKQEEMKMVADGRAITDDDESDGQSGSSDGNEA